MSDTLLVSTRKGLFTVSRKAQWEITAVPKRFELLTPRFVV